MADSQAGKWLTYMKERFPLPTYFLLVGGISLSGLYLEGGSFELEAFAVSFLGLMLFFCLLRMMDELKDFEKDRIAHPDRPLPRGLFQPTEFSRNIRVLAVAMLLFSLGAAYLTNPHAGIFYAIISVYLWLMYKEFYVGHWLAARPFPYAVTHQIIMIPITAFTVAVTRPELSTRPETLWLSLSILGAFFSYEVCRKLDPAAHPVLKTYVAVYGTQRTFLILCLTTATAAWGSQALGLGPWLWPVEALLLVAYGFHVARPGTYFKMTEVVATLSLLFHIWGIPAQHWIIH